MRIYLDACCLSRLTDDQSQPRIREEAAAVEFIISTVCTGEWELISSEALLDEARRNPDLERRWEVEALLSLASRIVQIDAGVTERARSLVAAGFGPFDALHLAAAESVPADVLLSTDDRFVGRASRGLGEPRISVRNPLSWIQERGLVPHKR